MRIPRSRIPRVAVSFDIEEDGVINTHELPCVIGVFGDFSGVDNNSRPRWADRTFADVTAENFNEVMAKMQPQCAVRSSGNQCHGTAADIILRLSEIEDFQPEELIDLITQQRTELQRDHADAQLKRVLASPELRALEATWRSL